jgi:integrase
MARGPHLLRRGAVYYWQRRLPTHLAKLLRISHVKVNLRTKDVAVARRLVPPLDVRAMEVFMDKSAEISREQLGSLFKAVLVEHQQKLCLLADLERANPTTARAELLETELAQGLAYKLLSEQGVNAHVHEQEQLRQLEEGRGADFIVKVIEHIARLHDGDEIKISRQRLARHIKDAGAGVNAISLVKAQPVYLRALGEALLGAEQRYGNQPIFELDFDALMEEARGGTAPDQVHAGAVADEKAAARASTASQPETPPQRGAVEQSGGDIASVAQALEKKRVQDNEWDEKTARQAKFIFSLFGRYMAEVFSITDLFALRQNHLADFDGFLRSLHSNFGKSTKDNARSIAEIRLIAKEESPKRGALQGPTRNRHLTFLGQLLKYARSGLGVDVDPALSTTAFRAKRDKRGRDQRPIPHKTDVQKLFERPVFTGYAHWDDIDTPGPEFFHRAEYYCTILAAYEGARREEYCGLALDDIIIDNGDIPYIHIAPNAFRRIKNLQSVRNLALHPEIIRLGFLDYVEAVKALGYQRLFPDLYSPSTRSPLGDRLYKQMLPSLRAVSFTPHQIRHFFGDELKQNEVVKEFRADLLGHGGESETTERYCNPISLQKQMEHLLKLPVVTAHLLPRPIQLLPWVIAKEVAPWSRHAKATKK